ncbi:hypothetical protein [Ancylomarina longa]|uniref:Uncharacterized protein n=1 Tax=Ancylomarina longa TaxID=2487017 RepID=A0A434AVG9_9BACT|nr:hypothetical protein [Ancylomarina longa]RUT78487.1 hypothetical protein DLK05_07885 [Ancylomarina longa]
MDNTLMIQLLRNKAEEIKSLLEHFQNHPNELQNEIGLLEDRIKSLSKDFNLLQTNIKNDSEEFELNNEKEQNLQGNKEIKDNPVFKTKKNHINEDISKESKFLDNSTINDQLKSDSTNIISDKLSSQKLTDIRTAIGINDKFLFIKELFDSKKEDYNSSIEFLNQSTDLGKIQEWMVNEKNWDIENPTVKQFTEIIKRKF